MQENRFEVGFAHVHRVDLDAQFIRPGHCRGEGFFCFGDNDRHGVVAHVSFHDPLQCPNGGSKAFGIVVLTDMQDERFHLANLFGQFGLGTQCDEIHRGQ